MTINEIKLLMESNNIRRVTISAAPMAPGKWSVQFERKSGEVVPLTARRENLRQFKTVDSAIKVLSTVGIKTAEIDWSGQQ